MHKPLFITAEWDFDLISRTLEECDELSKELKLDIYPNQIEVITSEQMLDAYASTGLPIMYKHWSFGKRFSQEKDLYQSGKRGLAYELVINSNPCISYLMEENTACTQVLVIAHAAFGHNHFFKNNYLFKQWTDADGIIDYLIFARNYVSQCEERYGEKAVEDVLSAAHSLMLNGIDRSKKPKKLNAEEEKRKQFEREEYLQRMISDLWRNVPKKKEIDENDKIGRFPKNPEENILYFLEKNSPILEPWQREVLRIVRKISQYFYPQYQTKVMNEGFATFTHYYMMNRLYDKDLLTDGAMIEFLKLHTNVVMQSDYDSRAYYGINPYYLGFEMFKDIKRICSNPTNEDKEWFPNIAGEDWVDVITDIAENYRDESFIKQYLSPSLIRKMKLFNLNDTSSDSFYTVSDIHNEIGYKNVRNRLSEDYDIDSWNPQIKIIDADIKGDRTLTLQFDKIKNRVLNENWRATAIYLKSLWGYPIKVVDNDGEHLGYV